MTVFYGELKGLIDELVIHQPVCSDIVGILSGSCSVEVSVWLESFIMMPSARSDTERR